MLTILLMLAPVPFLERVWPEPRLGAGIYRGTEGDRSINLVLYAGGDYISHVARIVPGWRLDRVGDWELEGRKLKLYYGRLEAVEDRATGRWKNVYKTWTEIDLEWDGREKRWTGRGCIDVSQPDRIVTYTLRRLP